MLKYFCELFVKKTFPKIKFILGNNAVEARGVKSNYFEEDLTISTFTYKGTF
jgi:hypothetical protein